jgi:hypothetical protein
MKISFWELFPITAFDYKQNTDFASEVKQDNDNRRSFAQTLAQRFNGNKGVRPFHAALIGNQVINRKYKFRSEMWNGDEVHIKASRKQNIENDDIKRKETRDEIVRYEHFHHQDLMTQADTDRINYLTLLKAFNRNMSRDLEWVALMTREAFVNGLQTKFMERWDKSQSIAKQDLNKSKGLTPLGAPQVSNNLEPSKLFELQALENRKLSIDPTAIENIGRLIAGTALQAMATNLPANPPENHLKTQPFSDAVSAAGSSSKNKAS